MTRGGLRAAFYLSIIWPMPGNGIDRVDEKPFAPDHGSV
jgi:hypothetical protein